MQSILRNLLVPFALAVIALGLWQVGGPEQSRMEQRDEQRMADVLALVTFLDCKALPDDKPQIPCGARPSDTDRFTGLRFEISDTKVCADFEMPKRLARHYREQLENGCVLRR